MKHQCSKQLIVLSVVVFIMLSLTYKAGAVAPGPKVSEDKNKHNLSSAVYNTNANPPALIRGFRDPSITYKATFDPGDVLNLKGREVCIFCHTPHNANVAEGAPLWNRAFSAQTFSRYSSETLQIRVNPLAKTPAQYDAPAWQPDGSSKLCLSCHDGVATNPLGAVLRGGPITMESSIDPAGGNFISSNTAISWASFNPSTNKMKLGHHPVSFVYNAAVVTAINDSFKNSYQLPLLPEVKLDKKGKMQCTTCHDAHQNQSHDEQCYGGGGSCIAPDTRKIAPFWVYGGVGTASDHQQAVCTTCHPMNAEIGFTGPWPP